jgi:Domain of unknown function (DUF6471)
MDKDLIGTGLALYHVRSVPRCGNRNASLTPDCDADVTYEELTKCLEAHGFKEAGASIANKLSRGTFQATFFLPTIAALELGRILLEICSDSIKINSGNHQVSFLSDLATL